MTVRTTMAISPLIMDWVDTMLKLSETRITCAPHSSSTTTGTVRAFSQDRLPMHRIWAEVPLTCMQVLTCKEEHQGICHGRCWNKILFLSVSGAPTATTCFGRAAVSWDRLPRLNRTPIFSERSVTLRGVRAIPQAALLLGTDISTMRTTLTGMACRHSCRHAVH